jgi:hypothetical protein
VQQLILGLLDRQGPTAFDELVKQVAEQIYHEEVRRGAGVLDVGLFGPKIFCCEIAVELRAGNGVTWKIEEESRSNQTRARRNFEGRPGN